MATASTIIGKALRSIGIIASGDAATGSEYQDAFDSLNSIIDAWSVDPSFYFTEKYEPFTLTAAKASYNMGNASVAITSLTSATTTATAGTAAPHMLETGDSVTVSGATEGNYNVTAAVTVTGQKSFTYTIVSTTSPATGTPVFTTGDFSTTRPIRIIGAFTRAASVDTQIGIVTESYWDKIPAKATQAAAPLKLLYRAAYPFGRVLLYPTPSGTPTLYLTSEKIISQFVDLTTDNYLPPGYQKMLELALAVDLTSEYGTKVTDAVSAQIKASYDAIMATNRSKLQSNKLQPSNGNGA